MMKVGVHMTRFFRVSGTIVSVVLSALILISLVSCDILFAKKVSVNDPVASVSVSGVSVSPTSTTLQIGGTKQLVVTVSPSNASNSGVSYSSGNTGIATVSMSGLITAVATGTTAITATTSDGGKTAVCTVLVTNGSALIMNLPASGTYSFTDLVNQSVYLVKLNNSPNIVDSVNTGSVTSSKVSSIRSVSALDESGQRVTPMFNGPSGTVPRYENKNAQEAMTHPPVFPAGIPAATGNARNARSASAFAATLMVGTSTRNFLVASDGNETSYKTITATLRGSGTHAQVWVASGETVSSATAASIAATFDKIYPVETAIFGYEYGGDPGDTAHAGGMDGETPVNILIYDIDYDGAPAANEGRVVGFFYPKDEYIRNPQANNITAYSNESEIFYIDSWFTVNNVGVMYSTLVHEFQHMIGYNEKWIRNKQSSNSWYTEMLSQVAEDMMSTDLESWLGSAYDVVSDGPIVYRMQYFTNGAYNTSGVTDWLPYPDVYDSYASSYAFGAYLARNYGGVKLIKEIASNTSVDEASVSAALSALGYSENTFASVFSRYNEALIFSTSGFTSGTVHPSCNTFDRTVSTMMATSAGDHVYVFPAFDLWKIVIKYNDGSTLVGPYCSPLNASNKLRPYGLDLQTAPTWKNVTGNLTITVNKPANANVTLALMIRKAN